MTAPLQAPFAGGDPRMQAWVRYVNNQMVKRDRDIKLLSDYVEGQKKRVARTITDTATVQGSTGVNTEWQNLPPNQGPFLTVNCTTGLLKVSVAARQQGIRTDLTTTQAGLMCMSVSVDNELIYGGDVAAITAQGFTTTLHAVANAPTGFNPREVQTKDILIPLPVGEYLLKAEYFFWNFTAGIQPNWAYRTLTAESI